MNSDAFLLVRQMPVPRCFTIPLRADMKALIEWQNARCSRFAGTSERVGRLSASPWCIAPVFVLSERYLLTFPMPTFWAKNTDVNFVPFDLQASVVIAVSSAHRAEAARR